jgi:hypothetical protein
MVARIRSRAESGEAQKDIASVFGVSRPLVCQIINGKVRTQRTGTVGPEMKRRVIGAIDLGLREGEMLLLQVKHVDYATWTVNLPSDMTKAAEDQVVFAGTERLQKMLEERRFLGPDSYIFGRESGLRLARPAP